MSAEKAIEDLKAKLNEKEVPAPISIDEFIKYASQNPKNVFRNIFQLFADMIQFYLGKGVDEYPDDLDSINYIKYDCSRLFVDGTDSPFFADRPFANRLVNLSKSFREGSHRNKIYIFEGPVGSGKSTFLNNLLLKFEEYTSTKEGLTYELVWKIDRRKIGGFRKRNSLLDEYQNIKEIVEESHDADVIDDIQNFLSFSDPLEIPCPSHDNPILIIPKQFREEFISKFIDDKEFKKKLFNKKEYEWVFKAELCSICNSMYQVLLDKLNSPSELFDMIYVRKYQFNRRLGEGVSVYNPGDKIINQPLTNQMLQKNINNTFRDSNAVRYLFSELARTNNGIYSIMDIKSHNKNRLINLHGIISDSVHRVEHIEERINSLFIALLNPEDKDVIESVKSMGDRVLRLPIPYVLDYNTEVDIYRDNFGIEIDKVFLPRVLENFARVIISSRLNIQSKNIAEWIKDQKRYAKYCDKDLLLLKMDIYTGLIPTWLSEEDRKNFNAKLRKAVISESAEEGKGENSISGRKSIELFNEFYSKYAKNGKLIDMSKVYKFFSSENDAFKKIPDGFLDSLVTLYDYNILQEIKEALYNYNEKEIRNDILNYMFAINFEIGSKIKCTYTGIEFAVTEEFLGKIEEKLINDSNSSVKEFREYVQKEYTSKTLAFEMGVENKKIKDTSLFNMLMEKYQYRLKEDVLNPFLENDNFRNAIRDYGTSSFNSYDKKIIKDVRFLIRNLIRKFNYTEEGAKQVCIYVVDNDIPKKF